MRSTASVCRDRSCLLWDLDVVCPDQAWGTGFTDAPMPANFMNLAAIIGWFTRRVLAWLGVGHCLEAPVAAAGTGRSEMFNSDQRRAAHQPGAYGAPGGDRDAH